MKGALPPGNIFRIELIWIGGDGSVSKKLNSWFYADTQVGVLPRQPETQTRGISLVFKADSGVPHRRTFGSQEWEGDLRGRVQMKGERKPSCRVSGTESSIMEVWERGQLCLGNCLHNWMLDLLPSTCLTPPTSAENFLSSIPQGTENVGGISKTPDCWAMAQGGTGEKRL